MTKIVEYRWYCSECKVGFAIEPLSWDGHRFPYCPNCGHRDTVVKQPALQIPMIPGVKGPRYKVYHGHKLRHKPTDAEEDVIAASYEKGMKPEKLIKKYNISPGRLYGSGGKPGILAKHHIALIHKPKQKKFKEKK